MRETARTLHRARPVAILRNLQAVADGLVVEGLVVEGGGGGHVPQSITRPQRRRCHARRSVQIMRGRPIRRGWRRGWRWRGSWLDLQEAGERCQDLPATSSGIQADLRLQSHCCGGLDDRTVVVLDSLPRFDRLGCARSVPAQ